MLLLWCTYCLLILSTHQYRQVCARSSHKQVSTDLIPFTIDDRIREKFFHSAMDYTRESKNQNSEYHTIAVNAIGNISLSVLWDYIESDCKDDDETIKDSARVIKHFRKSLNPNKFKIKTYIDRNVQKRTCNFKKFATYIRVRRGDVNSGCKMYRYFEVRETWSEFSTICAFERRSFDSDVRDTYERDFNTMYGKYRKVQLGNTMADFITIQNPNSNENISVIIVLPSSSEESISNFARNFLSTVSYSDFFNATADEVKKIAVPEIEIYHTQLFPEQPYVAYDSTSKLTYENTIIQIKLTHHNNSCRGDEPVIVNRPFMFFFVWNQLIISSGIQIGY